MNLGDLKKQFRILTDDLAAPYLWDDPAITVYANEAVKEAATRARLIYDTETPDVTELSFTSGQSELELSPLILKVDRAIVVGDNKRALRFRPSWWLDEHWPGWRDFGPTEPRAYFDDEKKLTLVAAPSYDGTLKLAVYRLPLEDMEDNGDEPEIHARHHFALLHWMEHLAYSKRDADAQDQKRADAAEAAFAGYFGVRRDANVQRKQRERRPTIVQSNW